MIKTLLLAFIALVLWSSPEMRFVTANAMRGLAKIIEPTGPVNRNSKYFKVPNPFYVESKKDFDLEIDLCEDPLVKKNDPCLDRQGIVHPSYASYEEAREG